MKSPIVGTVYNGGYQLLHGRFDPQPYVVVVSVAGENRVPRLLTSSDLDALRQRLHQLGLSRHPPDPGDVSVIMEVWF
jgi:hypothetical protein